MFLPFWTKSFRSRMIICWYRNTQLSVNIIIISYYMYTLECVLDAQINHQQTYIIPVPQFLNLDFARGLCKKITIVFHVQSMKNFTIIQIITILLNKLRLFTCGLKIYSIKSGPIICTDGTRIYNLHDARPSGDGFRILFNDGWIILVILTILNLGILVVLTAEGLF